MFTHSPKKLSDNIDIDCYCCDTRTATHLCRFRLGELPVQVCLCEACMQLDTVEVFEKILGLPYLEGCTLMAPVNLLPI